MGRHGEAHGFLQAAPSRSGLRPSVLALELSPSLEAVRAGVALVRRGTPRASEVLEKVHATLRAIEPVIQLLDKGHAAPLDTDEAAPW